MAVVRIAVLAPPSVPVPPTFYGGTEVVIDMLCRGYAAAGHEVVLFASRDSTCPVEVRSAFEVAAGEQIGHTEPELRHVADSYADAASFDVVHDHTLIGPMYAGRFPDVHVVTTIHLALAGNVLAIFERMPANVRLVAVSEAQRRPVPHLPITTVIHHGIDAGAFEPGPGGESLLFLGRMSPDKGVLMAIAAARKADVPLVLAGKVRSADEVRFFEEHVEPLLGDGVRFLGEVPHDVKVDLLRHARGLLFPTLWNEPFGMVMLEAMACGTPVVSTLHGAVPEVVDEGVTGFLCADEAAFAEGIARLDQIDRQACRDAVEGYFSADRMVRAYLSLFELVTQ